MVNVFPFSESTLSSLSNISASIPIWMKNWVLGSSKMSLFAFQCRFLKNIFVNDYVNNEHGEWIYQNISKIRRIYQRSVQPVGFWDVRPTQCTIQSQEQVSQTFWGILEIKTYNVFPRTCVLYANILLIYTWQHNSRNMVD